MKTVCVLLTTFALTSYTPIPSTELSTEELKTLYQNYYLASNVDGIDWTSKGGSDPGQIPKEIYEKVEKRINFFRLVNRLPLIKVVPDKQLEAQSAAFMIKENNEVDHHPPKTWKYYSEAGANGAAHSCLGLSDFSYFPQTSFITGFIQEPGEINSFVGHRRWILFSKVKKFSYGATDKSEALYCIEEFSKDTVKTDFIAYPWNGYVPANLIFRKWSFAIPEGHDVNFKHVKITIKNNVGNSIPFEMYPENPDYPDKTITWKMTSMFTEQEEEQEINNLKAKGYIGKEISVKIENVEVDHRTKNYEYKVKIVDLK